MLDGPVYGNVGATATHWNRKLGSVLNFLAVKSGADLSKAIHFSNYFLKKLAAWTQCIKNGLNMIISLKHVENKLCY